MPTRERLERTFRGLLPTKADHLAFLKALDEYLRTKGFRVLDRKSMGKRELRIVKL